VGDLDTEIDLDSNSDDAQVVVQDGEIDLDASSDGGQVVQDGAIDLSSPHSAVDKIVHDEEIDLGSNSGENQSIQDTVSSRGENEIPEDGEIDLNSPSGNIAAEDEEIELDDDEEIVEGEIDLESNSPSRGNRIVASGTRKEVLVALSNSRKTNAADISNVVNNEENDISSDDVDGEIELD